MSQFERRALFALLGLIVAKLYHSKPLVIASLALLFVALIIDLAHSLNRRKGKR